VVASGNDPRRVWEAAKKKCPEKQPVLAFVPKEETLALPLDVSVAYRKHHTVYSNPH